MNKNLKPPKLSTSFSESSKRSKMRFEHILNTKAKKTGVLTFMLLVLMIGFISAMVACENQANIEQFAQVSLQKQMGEKKAVVIDKLGIDESNVRIEEQMNEEKYSFETTVKNNPCVVSVIFYNEIMMGYQYQFQDTKVAYEYAKKVRANLESAYGKPMQSTTQASFDSLKSDSDITTTDVGMIYYEDWTPEKYADLEKEMLGDIDIERLDIRMQLSCLPNNHAFVIVRYNTIRKSLR